jgi:hypothetical protein
MMIPVHLIIINLRPLTKPLGNNTKPSRALNRNTTVDVLVAVYKICRFLQPTRSECWLVAFECPANGSSHDVHYSSLLTYERSLMVRPNVLRW